MLRGVRGKLSVGLGLGFIRHRGAGIVVVREKGQVWIRLVNCLVSAPLPGNPVKVCLKTFVETVEHRAVVVGQDIFP